MGVSARWWGVLVVLTVATRCFSVDEDMDYQSGDDTDINWDSPPKIPSTGGHGNRPGRPDGTGPMWPDVDNELGSADDDDEEESIVVPGLERPVGPGRGNEGGEQEGGAGIVIEPFDPTDDENSPHRKCHDQRQCHNGGTCFVNVATENIFCHCPTNFKGERCEVDDVLIDDYDGDTTDTLPETHESLTVSDILAHPVAIAVIVGAGVIFVSLLVTLLICCCRCIRKKDEGSYALDSAQGKIEYTRVVNSQEYYA